MPEDRQVSGASTSSAGTIDFVTGAPSGHLGTGRKHRLRVTKVIELSLQYEDQSPMADAEFEAVFGDQRVQGRTDEGGNAIVRIPAGEEETFRLFLLSFPERYVESEREGQSQAGCSKWFWPFDLLGWVLAFALLAMTVLMGCAASDSKLRDLQTKDGIHHDLPAVSVTLTGPIYTAVATSTVQLTILVDPARPSGTVQYGDQKPFTLRDPKLKVLYVSARGPVRSARYQLHYALNVCEHAKPVKQGTPITRWDPCYYVNGNLPIRLENAEVFLNRQRTPDGESFVAAGISDFYNLSVFRITGRAER